MNPRASLLVESLENRKLLASSAQNLPSAVQLEWNDWTGPALSDRWIVKLGGYDGAPASQLKKAQRLLGGADDSVEVRQYLVSDGLFLVQLHGEGQGARQQHERLSAMPGFVAAEPDWLITLDVNPNDPSFGSMHGLNNASDTDIDAPEAWNVATGSMSQIIGIVDSGVDYTHRDMAQNIFINEAEIPAAIAAVLVDTDGDSIITFRDLNNAANQGPGKITDLNGNGRIDGGDLINNASGWENGGDGDANGLIDDLIGWNFLSNNNDPMDVFSHGTHVAGTAGAVGNNSTDVVGVNWNVRILPLKSGGIDGSDNSISLAAAIGSIGYATGLRTRGLALRTLNASWGGGGFSSQLVDAIIGANAAGIMFVAAAGNGGADGVGDNNDATPHYPSSYEVPNVIAVLNLTSSGTRSFDSNFGLNSVDLGAPGTSILSTVPGGTAFFSGTSMASPHVAGAVALLFSIYPDIPLSVARRALLEMVDPIASLASITVAGGRLNLFRTITALQIAEPSSPDLTAASDSGVSDTDNITSDVTPTFSGVTEPNFTVRLFLNSSVNATTTAGPDGSWSITTPSALGNGTFNFSINVSNGAITSFRSTPVSVKIDNVAPIASNGTFNHQLSPQRLSVNFNEPVNTAFSPSNAIVTNITSAQVIDPAAMTFDYDFPTNRVDLRFPGLPSAIVPDGNYTVSVLASDAAGNAMTTPHNFSFFILYGDANRNRFVDISDFAIMAGNFNGQPRSFGQGDFNFDGRVDISDFALLGARFNQGLPAPGDLPRASSDGPSSVGDASTSLFNDEIIAGRAIWDELITDEKV